MLKKPSISCRPRTAVAYARYSSAGQRDVSIDQQLRDIRAYAEREGYTIVHEFADHARSGFKSASTRAEFQAMISAASSGSFDTVLCWKVDRFGRNREDSAIYKGQLSRLGVSVVYVMEPIPTGAAGVLTEGMLEAIAEWYSRNLSENVKRGMDDNASRCLFNGSRIFGYCEGPDHHYQIVPDQASIVRRIYSLCLSGASISSIASILNGSGSRNPYGKPWAHTFIYRILKQEKYTGVYIWKDLRIPDGMPVIIDRKTWEETQAMLSSSVRKKSSSNPVPYLLTGKAFCGHCNSPMIGDAGTGKNGTVHYYYACQSKKRRKGCSKKSVPKDYLEDVVIDFIFDSCFSQSGMEAIADAVMEGQKKIQQNSPLASLEKELSAVNRKIDNINDAIAEGIWNSTTKEKLDALTETRDQLQISISSLQISAGQLNSRASIFFYLKKLSSLDRHDPKERQYLINTFLHSVYVFDDHLKIYINAVESASSVPFSPLLSCSDNVSEGPPFGTHPNPYVLEYVVPM